jgi:ABC-type nitrate/sulfonate/bicarbonate transport system substrate-binding protein
MKTRLRPFLALALTILVLGGCNRAPEQKVAPATPAPPAAALTKVRVGVSPFQDTLLPIVGRQFGWYKQEGLDVDFKILGWTEVMEALSANQVDVAVNNDTSVVATHERNPNLVYYYALNPFDNGFALMIRPNGRLKTLQQIQAKIPNRDDAVRATAAQLKGRTVITTGNTDMEQGVSAAARRGGLDFKRDIKIIDLNPDEGLAAFLRGEGDAYIGGIPQRTRAGKEGMVEMLTGADLGPPPINGFVTTKQYAAAHQAELLKLLRVWFRTVKFINTDMAQGAAPIIQELNKESGAQFTLDDFKKFWNVYEHYPQNPAEVETLILSPNGRNYWQARWDDSNNYFFAIKKTIPKPVDAKDAFLMPEAQAAYVAKYGKGDPY